MEETTKAYLAGLIDADGHISILSATSGRTNPQYWLQIGITQSDKDFLKLIQEKIGAGKIYRNNKARTNGFHSQERYQLQIFGKSAVKLLEQLCDFLILKRQQAKVGIEFGKTISASRAPVNHLKQAERERLRCKMRLLNGVSTEQEDSSALREMMELDKLRQWQGGIGHPYLEQRELDQ